MEHFGKIDPYYGLALISFLQDDHQKARKEIREYRKNQKGKTSRKDNRKLSSLEDRLETEGQYSMNEIPGTN